MNQKAEAAKRRLDTAIYLQDTYAELQEAARRRVMHLTAEYLRALAGVEVEDEHIDLTGEGLS